MIFHNFTEVLLSDYIHMSSEYDCDILNVLQGIQVILQVVLNF